MSPAVAAGSAGGMVPRSSTTSTSSRSTAHGGSTRRSNNLSGSSVPLSQIEKSVTHLLVATKQLLETLTQWSRGQASDAQVSDVYVRLGYEFNMACRAFTAINVDTKDLGNVPEELRAILEATLSQVASAESLERYLPKIRDIIINLLHGLKRKQQKLRQRQARERDPGGMGEPPSGRTTSTSTTGSASSSLASLLNEQVDEANRPDIQREDSKAAIAAPPTRRSPPQRDQSRLSIHSEQSSLSSNTMKSIPIAPPYPGDESTIPTGPSTADLDSFPPPPPPPKQQSALAALQRGGELERRASRRYSAYQIQKHLGAQGPGVPMLPSQTTPVPNRGRGEVRESMRAMQARSSIKHSRNTSSQSRGGGFEPSPVRIPSRVPEGLESGASDAGATVASFSSTQVDDSSTAQTPDDKYPKPSATLRGPPTEVYPAEDFEENREVRSVAAAEAKPPTTRPPRASTPDKPRDPVSVESSPASTKELTLFLQYKSKVKKFVLPEGYSELSIGRLQLAFIEKFSWNTQQNGVDLPDIYIQDPVSGVRHELEDLADIKDRTVLALNVEPLDEVKKHIDEGIGSLRSIVELVKQNVDDQGAALQRVSERQQDTAKDLARLAAAPSPVATPPPSESPRSTGPMSVRRSDPGQMAELQNLRRDLAVLRQTYSNFQSEIQGSMTALRNKANGVKVAAAKMSIPDVEGDTGYAYVKHGRKELNADSDRLVNQVDDLQDLVEEIRKDVVHRGVRPLPRQLESVGKDIALLNKELKKMDDYIKREKPIWTKIWEKELEDVCQGRDELRLMEDLMVDLRDDIEKATETFALVEQATKEQMKDAGPNTGGTGPLAKQFSRSLNHLVANADVDPSVAKEGVLGEVRALQPNHENRLEAIERAEKLRQKELERRHENPLKKELAHFVEEGRLKKSGGVEEVERARRAKDDRIRREVWERQNGIAPLPEEPVADDDDEDEDEDEDDDGGDDDPAAAGNVDDDEGDAGAAETADEPTDATNDAAVVDDAPPSSG